MGLFVRRGVFPGKPPGHGKVSLTVDSGRWLAVGGQNCIGRDDSARRWGSGELTVEFGNIHMETKAEGTIIGFSTSLTGFDFM